MIQRHIFLFCYCSKNLHRKISRHEPALSCEQRYKNSIFLRNFHSRSFLPESVFQTICVEYTSSIKINSVLQVFNILESNKRFGRSQTDILVFAQFFFIILINYYQINNTVSFKYLNIKTKRFFKSKVIRF